MERDDRIAAQRFGSRATDGGGMASRSASPALRGHAEHAAGGAPLSSFRTMPPQARRPRGIACPQRALTSLIRIYRSSWAVA